MERATRTQINQSEGKTTQSAINWLKAKSSQSQNTVAGRTRRRDPGGGRPTVQSGMEDGSVLLYVHRDPTDY